MLIRFCFALLFVAVILPVHAQDGGVVKMVPEFCFTFPVVRVGRDVTVKYPVLINPATVVKPGMVLRTLYVLTQGESDAADLVIAHQGTIEQSYARDSTSSSTDKVRLTPELTREIEGYRRTIWDVPNNFVLAMAQYPTDAMHLIFSPSGKESDLDDEHFSFFDGMFIGLPGGKVTVLSVEKESKADRAGIKAGDEIEAVGGVSTHDDLATFASAYANTKAIARENETSSYVISIRSGGKSDVQSVYVSMPPRIKSSLMDGF